MSDEAFAHPNYAERVFFVRKTVNNRGKADEVFEFVDANSPAAIGLNKKAVILKQVEKKKYLPSNIVRIMKGMGFSKFNMRNHTELWQSSQAKEPSKAFGTNIAGSQWYWYESWLDIVKKHCQESGDKYK